MPFLHKFFGNNYRPHVIAVRRLVRRDNSSWNSFIIRPKGIQDPETRYQISNVTVTVRYASPLRHLASFGTNRDHKLSRIDQTSSISPP